MDGPPCGAGSSPTGTPACGLWAVILRYRAKVYSRYCGKIVFSPLLALFFSRGDKPNNCIIITVISHTLCHFWKAACARHYLLEGSQQPWGQVLLSAVDTGEQAQEGELFAEGHLAHGMGGALKLWGSYS